MSVFARLLYPVRGTTNHNVIVLYGRVLLGNTGALDTTYNAATDTPGATVARSTTGTYTITLDGSYAKLLWCKPTLLGAPGAGGYVGNVSTESASTGVITVQWTKGSNDTVTEIANGLSWMYEIALQTTSVTP